MPILSDDASENIERHGKHISPADNASDFLRKSRLLRS
jgi:hypothetical protein